MRKRKTTVITKEGWLSYLEEMVGKVLGDEVIKALGAGLYEASGQVFEATFVLDKMRRIEVVPEQCRADWTVPGEQTAKGKGGR